MLSEVLKKYEIFKKNNQKSLQTLKGKLQQNFQDKTIQALKIQNHKVSKIHSNQQQIENRLRRNTQLQAQMKLHLGDWVMLYQDLNKALKQAGHLVNYAEYVHEEIKQIGAELGRRIKSQQQNEQRNKEVSNEWQKGEKDQSQELINRIVEQQQQNNNNKYDISDMP